MISMAQAPLQLSKYKLIEVIGHGGMATVYRAHDTRLGREVALKLIHRHLRQNDEVEARFNSEARAVAKLRHPNIVEVFDVSDEDDDERYLIVELIRGTTLRELLTQHGALPVELAAEIVLELSGALEHAHGMGVIHRDIKPENVLVEACPATALQNEEELRKPRVKLTDFGIAKLLDAQGITSTGQVLGSPAHMAPEQIEGKPVDRRADIFSLGVLFYECIVGTLPFEGKNPAQVLRNVLEGNFQPPDRVRPEIGSRWSEILVKTLSRDPDDRYSSIEEFGEEVRRELRRVEFEDARADITRFLVNPAEYDEEFPNRIARGLSKCGRRSRAQRDRAMATAQFSRALAYKPGDPALLKQVSGLRRDKTLRRGIVYFAGAAALLGAGWVSVEAWPEATPEPPKPKTPPASTTPVATGALPAPTTPGPPTTPRRATTPNPTTRADKRDTPKRVPPPPTTTEIEADETRMVSVLIRGASGGTLRIDGQQKAWFGGVTHELSVGEHVFEFVPPNDTCCVQTRKRLLVLPGEGVQEVRGEIPFKDSGLSVSAPESRGWIMVCPALFAEPLHLPGQRSVAMSEVTVTGICTLSNPSLGSDKRQKTVSLRAGQTTVLPWP